MCEPISLTTGILLAAGTGVSAGSAIVNYKSQKHDAQVAQQQNEEYRAANEFAAKLSTHQTLGDLTQRELEEMLAAAEEQQTIHKEGTKIISTAKVAAGEAGVMGHSVEAVLNDLQAQEARAVNVSKTNENIRLNQIQREKEAAIVAGQNAINTVQPIQVRQPSILSPALQIAGTGLSLIDYMQTRKTNLKTAGGS